MPKRRRTKDLREPIHNPQKYKWHLHKSFPTYEMANSERIELLKEHKNVKVQRSDVNDTKFMVKLGTPIKTNKKKKGEEDASE